MTPNKQNVWNIRDPKFESDRINPWLKTSPWSGHRSFAYDLLAFVQPARVLELGTHYGASFFAFCQSAKDLGLTTKIVGIDSWEGDIHAGFYGEEVWESVQAIKSTCFTNIDALCIRKLFNDALPDVEDNSVDILHIDGLHTYEAVSHDYKSWLPKLADDGIVLFHDVGKETGYGSHEFWKEISKDLPHYTFEHSWGLGVLFPKGARWYDQMEA